MELASLAQLALSHRRHDEVMAELLQAARRLAAGRADDGDRDRVHRAVAYFQQAATRHFVDEEGSVFPRLSTRRPELSAAIVALSAEHPAQITLHADLARAARELGEDPRPGAGKVLLDAAIRLAEAHHLHVSREDQIFAAAQGALTAEDDAEIVAEMEMRRVREPGAGGARPRAAARPRTTARARPSIKRSPQRASVAARTKVQRTAKAPAASSKRGGGPKQVRTARKPSGGKR